MVSRTKHAGVDVMKWNKSTRLALYAALEMARAGEALVTPVDVAAKYRVSAHHLAKIFQQLTRAGIAASVMGVTGGYRLARAAKDITLLDIVETFEGPIRLDRCLLEDAPSPCGDVDACRIKRIFDEIDQQAFFTLKSTRLSMLLASNGG